KDISSGHRLGSICELEFEKVLCGSIKTASDIANDYKDLQDIYLESIVCELKLEDKVIELKKKLAKEDILKVLQKVLSEKDYCLQDANTHLEKALSEKDSLLHKANAHIKKHLTNFEKKPNSNSFETQ
ncbi:11448_t:CDS:2, partial [Funneliformis geosporum]